MERYFETKEEIDEALVSLPDQVCPHCGARRTLARHDWIWRSGGEFNGMRGKRVYCRNRRGRTGCGRTFTLWMSDTLRGRCLRAAELMRFIIGLLAGLSVWKAWRRADTGMTERTGHRTFHRLSHTQTIIRTALFGLSPPPVQGKEKTPLLETLKILKEALGTDAVSAYQKKHRSAFP